MRGRHSRSLWGPGEGRGACVEKINSCPLLECLLNARRYHRACQASMMKELPIASSVFSVRGPVIIEDQC